MSTKQELEQQLNDAIAVAQRLNEEIKTLRTANAELTTENESLKNDFTSAIERVRYLDGQVNMLESQRQAATKYSDSNKNY
jgi:FtsZ-binding cell division protein ZapB